MFSRVKGKRHGGRPRRWSGLRARMTLSYVFVSLVFALLVELVVFSAFYIAISFFGLANPQTPDSLKQTAGFYAAEIALQAGGNALDPRETFQPGQPTSITLPQEASSLSITYIAPGSSPSQNPLFAVLIAPDGRILASSYPDRYPVSAQASQVLPAQTQLIRAAMAGKAGETTNMVAQVRIFSVAQTVWSSDRRPIGVVYFQQNQPLPLSNLSWMSFWGVFSSWLLTGLFWLFLFVPFGVLFGFFTTRGLVRRIRRLAATTTRFASGHYEQRLPALESDEVGQLEFSFNQMADQLIESMAQRQVLIEQNARQAERARIEQEMRTAQFIQKSLLPRDVPSLPGWRIARYYQPAREVGGDFYDFHEFEDGRLGIVIGDATDKGVAAALMMATTCTMLRTAAQEITSPADVLARVNQLLTIRIPPGMFVTCFYGVLDLANGHMRYANAGHDWPYRRAYDRIAELQAAGMPLGMLPGSNYDEHEVTLMPGESVLLFSDGLVEAHNQERAMFGLAHLSDVIKAYPSGGTGIIEHLLDALTAFTGAGWEQEDDVTMIAFQRAAASEPEEVESAEQNGWRTLSEWTVPSEPGNERQAMEQVASIVQPLHLSEERLESLKTAVAEVAMNAMEHGNHYLPDVDVTLRVLASETAVAVRISDQGTGPSIVEPEMPDIDAKLAESQAPRGWGLFLAKSLVDELSVTSDEHSHTVELLMRFDETGATAEKG